MVKHEPFLLEEFVSKHLQEVKHSLAGTCPAPVSIADLEKLAGEKFDIDGFLNNQLTYEWINGSTELKNEISKIYESINSDNIVITNGGTGANFLSFYSVIQPGDHAIVVDPIFQQLNSVPKLFGATIDKWLLKEENNWQPDINELENLIKPNTKIIVLSSPNNPTGAFIPIDDLNKIVEIAMKHDLYVLCDEVYTSLYHSTSKDEIPKSIADIYDKGISTGTMSKSFGLAGLRLGWIVSKNKSFINDCLSRRQYNIVTISSINDMVATYALKNKDKLLERNSKICIENLEIIKDAVTNSNGKLDVFIPKAGTTCFIKVNGIEDTHQLCLDLIKDEKVAFIPGEIFGYPGYLRVGFGGSKDDVIICIDALLKHLNGK